MADYCTLTKLKAYIWPDGTTPDSTNDAQLTTTITAVSRWIDNFCGRRFYTTDADETRYYTAQDGDILFLPDDVLSITTLATDDDGDRTYETTWATTDYDLLPLNATPYTWIEITPEGDETFPTHRKGVKIIGKFGFCLTTQLPAAIEQACLLQCTRIWKRRDAPFGVVSNPAGGSMRLISDLDPDVQQSLEPYRRVV